MHIADDADHGQRAHVAVHVAVLQALSDRIAVGPDAARERGADHRDVRRIGAVAVVEQPAALQRDSDRIEIAGAGNAVFGIAELRRQVRQVVEVRHCGGVPERAVRAGVGQRQRIDAADLAHAGQHGDAPHQFRIARCNGVRARRVGRLRQ